MTYNQTKQIAYSLIALAEELSDDECLIDSCEVLECIEGRLIAEEDVGKVKIFLANHPGE
ncbi:MAG: hypothetical protein GY928_00300 [Colwellia sp.]|nr:hypothetical protein [Colwellia sp.]